MRDGQIDFAVTFQALTANRPSGPTALPTTIALSGNVTFQDGLADQPNLYFGD
jgi:hypothetical protein